MSELLEQKDGARTTQEVLTHHLNCFGDIAGTMADYSAEARFFTQDGLLRGSEAIRRFFVRLFEEFAKPGMTFEMLQTEVDGTPPSICSSRRSTATPPTSCGRPRRRTTASNWAPTASLCKTARSSPRRSRGRSRRNRVVSNVQEKETFKCQS
jgi:hypothetical protein